MSEQLQKKRPSGDKGDQNENAPVTIVPPDTDAIQQRLKEAADKAKVEKAVREVVKAAKRRRDPCCCC